MEEEVHTGQCHHCGDGTFWISDPAPDLCAMCAVAGRWSALWGPEQSAEYLASRFRRKSMPMIEKKPLTTVLAALDASGSMYGVADDVRGGFNQYMTDLAADPDNEYRVTLCTFNTFAERITEDALPAEMPQLDHHNYRPFGGTALLDAIGTLITAPTTEPGSKVLVLIHTDGKENSSREWSKPALVSAIDAFKAKGWTFVFLGAGVDNWQQGEDLGMSSVSTRGSAAGTRGTYRGIAGQTVALASGDVDGEQFAHTVREFSEREDDASRGE
jgi:hypothetical protein